MGTPRQISMSITPDDEDIVRAAELETFQGHTESLEVYYVGSGTIDPFTKTLIPADPQWVVVSGIVVNIMEDDVLLGMGGHISVGDWKAVFPWPDIETYYDAVEKIKKTDTGEVFQIGPRFATGLGPTRNRAEFALKQVGA